MNNQRCMETVYDRCMYKNCRNGKYSTGSHLFRFPIITDTKCKLWICNSGNTVLEKWSATSLRRAGLCGDHFSPSSFKGEDKKKLKRDAIPVKCCSPFNCCSQKESESTNAGTEQNMEITQTLLEINDEHTYNDVEIGHSSAQYNVITRNKQPFKTYHSAKLNFDISEEEENVMEWIHLEPSTNKNSTCHATPINNNTTIDIRNNANKKKESKIKGSEIKNIHLKREIIRLRCTIKNLKNRLHARKVYRKVITEKSKKRIVQDVIEKQNLHPVAKAMINLQLHLPKTPYTQEEKSLSQQLYYYSASALRRLRQAGCTFPSERTIRRWHEELKIMPGFCDFMFSILHEKIKNLPAEERICALKWDEMYIKSYEEFSLYLGQVEGLVDLGSLGRKNERAKCVFVFCLDSINAHHPWRQPLAYFFPGKGGMKAEEIIILLKECLDRLNKVDADVRIVTCDQGSCNQSAYNQLGVHPDKSYFIYNEKKYYASFDFPHLIKRLASLLRKYKYLYCDGQVIASYSDFEMTWSVDNAAKGGSNLLPHITPAHLYPNTFEAMNVKRAFQLFGNKFAAAMKTAGYGKQLQSNTWEMTANFIERMNNVIDACNSYSYKMKFGGKRLLSNKNPDIEYLLIDFVTWCSKWSTSPEKKLNLPCLKGFVLTVQALLGTYNDLKMQNEMFELATGLCNQDSVEHLFSKLRQRGGFNPNPTARMVRLSLRHILYTGYIHTSDRGNVQCPEAECLINQPTKCIKAIENSMSANNIPIQYDIDPEDELFADDVNILEEYDNIESDIDQKNENSLSSYDYNAITFFAGYIARKNIAKSNCDNCRDIMMKTPMDNATENEIYIEYREYSNPDEDAPTVTKLVRPTTRFAKIVENQLQTFNRVCEHHWASTEILQKITNECKHIMNKIYPEWLDEDNPCYKHRLEALQFLIRVKLYSRTRYNNRSGRKASLPHRKLQKLLNK